jgi:hypothetical protein
LNAGAALFHIIQSIIVFSIIGWLDTKPIKQHYTNVSVKIPIYNASNQQIIGYNGSVDSIRPVDFLNKKPGTFPLFKTISIWREINKDKNNDPMKFSKVRAMSSDFFIETREIHSGDIDVRYIIAAFFALSGIFQIIGGYFYANKTGSRLRFVEYSFSASIMIMAIAVEAGIRDLYIIVVMFILIWITQMLGLLAETLSEISERGDYFVDEPLLGSLGAWSWLLPHFCGWATCVAAYAPILDHFHESSKASDTQAPDFVNVIIYLQFALFSCFGIVQLYSLLRRTYVIQTYSGVHNSSVPLMKYSSSMSSEDSEPSTREYLLANIADTTERIYIVLSFTAKTLLAWLILSPIITDAM